MFLTRKKATLIITLILTVTLTACGGSGDGKTDKGITLTGEVSGEITISCYDTMAYKNFLETTAGLFEEKYPGTKVNVETFSAMPEIKTSEQGGKTIAVVSMEDDPQGRADYINKTNTKLMSDSGADILAMDVLPVYKYADSGQLENLAAYMEADPDFNRGDYRGNILDAIAYNGGTWFLPLDYIFDYYTYDSTLLAEGQDKGFGTKSKFTSEQLIELAKPEFKATDSIKMFSVTDYMAKGMSMFSQLLEENYSYFVDIENKEARFDDGQFAGMLESVKEYAKLGYTREGFTGQMDAGEMMKAGAQQQTDRYYYKSMRNFSLMQRFNQGSGRNMVIGHAGMGGIETDDEIAGMQADHNGDVQFSYSQAYGINADSKNKETAWAFIKFMLSEEIQTSTGISMASLPINNNARDQKAEMMISGAFMSSAKGEGMFFNSGGAGKVKSGDKTGEPAESANPGVPIEQDDTGEPMEGDNADGAMKLEGQLDDVQKEVLRKYIEAYETLSDQINSCRVEDTIINDMIATEVQFFFDGSKTADQVASALQSKIELYLNE